MDTEIRPTNAYRPPSPEFPSATNSARKHARDSVIFNQTETTPQPSQKRGRKSAAERNLNLLVQPSTPAAMTVTDAGSVMDVDQVNGHDALLANGKLTTAPIEAPPAEANGVVLDAQMDIDQEGSPHIQENSPHQDQLVRVDSSPIVSTTLADGATIGIQVDPVKTVNLASTTTIVNMPDHQAVVHSKFSPVDPQHLVIASEHACGSVRVHASPPGALGSTPIYKNFVDLLEDNLVTAFAWSHDGMYFAFATYNNMSGQVYVIDGQLLSVVEILPMSQQAVISLKWMTPGRHLLAISADDDVGMDATTKSAVFLWDLADVYNIPPPTVTRINDAVLDVDTMFDNDRQYVLTCGDLGIYQHVLLPGRDLSLARDWKQMRLSAPWTFVYGVASTDSNEGLVLTASADAMALWLPNHGIFRDRIHKASITALELRPSLLDSTFRSRFYDFATSSLDHTIKVWQFDNLDRVLHNTAVVALDLQSPAMTLSYSPDGFYLAGASYDQIRIWSADSGLQLLASWAASNDEWRGARAREEDVMSVGGLSSVNGEHTPGADQCLAWNRNSKALVFSLGSQVRTSVSPEPRRN